MAHLLLLIHLFTFLIILIPSLGSGAAALLSHSLVVHGELCSSLERPTPLIFIPTLHPHLHLSPPPRPPHPSLSPSLPYLTLSRTLPPSLLRFARLLSLTFLHLPQCHAALFTCRTLPSLPPLRLSFLLCSSPLPHSC